jgi:tetratricopeptide (TPR) repeat protein
MAMVYLTLDDTRQALREIKRAAAYRRRGRSLVVLALQALIEFHADPRSLKAVKHFEQLRQEAFERRCNDERDFSAWEFEGLALAGLNVGRTDQSLDAAVEAFRRARRLAPSPPRLRKRWALWLEILQAQAPLGRLRPVLEAATEAAEAQPG